MIDEYVNIVDKIEKRAFSLLLRSDNIIHIRYKAVDEFVISDFYEIHEGIKQLGSGKKFLVLMTFDKFFIVDKEVRDIAASETGGQYTLADAIVVKSTALKLLVNFYISFNKPARPTRLFDSEEKAVEWLKKFL